jgi:hypothetical protein
MFVIWDEDMEQMVKLVLLGGGGLVGSDVQVVCRTNSVEHPRGKVERCRVANIHILSVHSIEYIVGVAATCTEAAKTRIG